MKNRLTFFLFVTVVFIFFSTLAFAFGPHEKERPGGKFRTHAREVMKALQLTDRLKRFFQLLKIEQDKIKPVPLPDFYSRVACGLQKIGGADRDRSPYFSYRRRTLPWALVPAASNGILLNPDSKSDARNSIEWSNRICMLRL